MFKVAQDNLQRNAALGLDKAIKLAPVERAEDVLLHAVPRLKPDLKANGPDKVKAKYDMVVCNPPFFAPDQAPQNVTGHRRPPQAIAPGALNEARAEGGEVAFVGRMVADSAQLGSRVLWYTAMLGCKSSLQPIMELLRGLEGVAGVVKARLAQVR